jgi:hypothetical protein
MNYPVHLVSQSVAHHGYDFTESDINCVYMSISVNMQNSEECL